jgi:hypothetical protein
MIEEYAADLREIIKKLPAPTLTAARLLASFISGCHPLCRMRSPGGVPGLRAEMREAVRDSITRLKRAPPLVGWRVVFLNRGGLW